MSAPEPSMPERLRAICMALPEATEEPMAGHTNPAFRVRGKIFAQYETRDERASVWCKGAPGAQELLIEADPERYFRPPYIGHRGWIGIYLDDPDDPAGDAHAAWDDVADLIGESYRMIAPKKLVRELDARSSDEGSPR